jgi:hypothetical protein
MWKFKICTHENYVNIQNFKTSSVVYHIYMGYNVHDVYNKVVFYITLDSTFKISKIWYDFQLSSFFKMKHKIYKEFVHFYRFIFILKWLRIVFWLIGAFLIDFHNKLQKKSFKKLFVWKSYFEEKDM